MEGQTGYLVEAANDRAGATRQGSRAEERASRPAAGRSPSTSTRRSRRRWRRPSTASWTSKLDPKKRKVDETSRPAPSPWTRRPAQVVALYGGVGLHRALHVNNATRTRLPARLHLQAAHPRLRPGERRRDPGRQADHRRTRSTTAPASGRSMGSDTAASPRRTRTTSTTATITVQTAMNKSDQLRLRADGRRRRHGQGEEDRLRARHEGRQGLARACPRRPSAPWAPAPGDGRGLRHPRQPRQEGHPDHREVGRAPGPRRSSSPDPIGDQVISREAADTVTSVLTGVVDDGTARPCATRSGDSRWPARPVPPTNNKSAWFTGYTPDLVTSVGLFGEDAQGRQAGHADRHRSAAAGSTAVASRPRSGRTYTFGALDGEADASSTWTPTQGAAVAARPDADARAARRPRPSPRPGADDRARRPSQPRRPRSDRRPPAPTAERPRRTPTPSTPIPTARDDSSPPADARRDTGAAAGGAERQCRPAAGATGTRPARPAPSPAGGAVVAERRGARSAGQLGRSTAGSARTRRPCPCVSRVAPQRRASRLTRYSPRPPSSVARACRSRGSCGTSSPTSQRSTSVRSSRRVIGRSAYRTALVTTSLTSSSTESRQLLQAPAGQRPPGQPAGPARRLRPPGPGTSTRHRSARSRRTGRRAARCRRPGRPGRACPAPRRTAPPAAAGGRGRSAGRWRPASRAAARCRSTRPAAATRPGRRCTAAAWPRRARPAPPPRSRRRRRRSARPAAPAAPRPGRPGAAAPAADGPALAMVIRCATGS